MTIIEMNESDAQKVVPLYIDYYNHHEDSCWTETTATTRITQVLSIRGGYSLMLVGDDGDALGFAMGFFKQYDDIVGYTLEEVVIAADHQHQGLGSALLRELEGRVRTRGASCIELEAVKDDLHDAFYGKLGFKNAGNATVKVKWFE